MAYLVDHPPASRQFGARYEQESGCVVVHVAVSTIDVHPPDNGAEAVASFISTRLDPGSYHVIVDSDSWIELVPATMRAFHVAASGINQFTWGISFACSDVDWRQFPMWDAAAMLNAADAIGAYLVGWATRVHGDPARARDALRWISTEQAYAREPGLAIHGQFQADRTDAWENHPDRAQLEADLLALVIVVVDHLLTPEPPDHPPEPVPWGARWFASQEA